MPAPAPCSRTGLGLGCSWGPGRGRAVQRAGAWAAQEAEPGAFGVWVRGRAGPGQVEASLCSPAGRFAPGPRMYQLAARPPGTLRSVRQCHLLGSWMPLWCPPIKVGIVLGPAQLVWPLSPSPWPRPFCSLGLCAVSPCRWGVGPDGRAEAYPEQEAPRGSKTRWPIPGPSGPAFHPPSRCHPRGGTWLVLHSAGPAEQAGGPECPWG